MTINFQDTNELYGFINEQLYALITENCTIQTISQQLARAIGGHEADISDRMLKIMQVKENIEKLCGCGDMADRSKREEFTSARYLFCRHMTEQGFSLKQISSIIGRDHATVTYFNKMYDSRVRTMPSFRRLHDAFQTMKELSL